MSEDSLFLRAASVIAGSFALRDDRCAIPQDVEASIDRLRAELLGSASARAARGRRLNSDEP
jgi:hypothetical protein